MGDVLNSCFRKHEYCQRSTKKFNIKYIFTNGKIKFANTIICVIILITCTDRISNLTLQLGKSQVKDSNS